MCLFKQVDCSRFPFYSQHVKYSFVLHCSKDFVLVVFPWKIPSRVSPNPPLELVFLFVYFSSSTRKGNEKKKMFTVLYLNDLNTLFREHPGPEAPEPLPF